MSRTIRQLLTFTIFGLGLVVLPFSGQANAQATGDPAGTSPSVGAGSGTSSSTGGVMSRDTDTGTTTKTTRDEGSNLGWLGLLGLAGLAGLMPKKVHPVVTTTHRTGDTTSR